MYFSGNNIWCIDWSCCGCFHHGHMLYFNEELHVMILNCRIRIAKFFSARMTLSTPFKILKIKIFATKSRFEVSVNECCTIEILSVLAATP